MQKEQITHSKENCSYKNAHIFNEFAKILQNIGTDIENSVSLFDSIGEKNEVFQTLERSIDSPSIEPIIDMNSITQQEIYNFVFRNFVKTFSENKDKFNFIHVGKNDIKKVVFFISAKDNDTKEALYFTEFEYATGDLSNFLDVSFCFVENDMEKDLYNTQKIELSHA